mmetsp:Transcript_34671/g.83763  ORF Transcript_34671/g.83763 Transcript_34671/m.83763 type:complete len:217 (+) Transcript_34671:460-1110(+)
MPSRPCRWASTFRATKQRMASCESSTPVLAGFAFFAGGSPSPSAVVVDSGPSTAVVFSSISGSAGLTSPGLKASRRRTICTTSRGSLKCGMRSQRPLCTAAASTSRRDIPIAQMQSSTHAVTCSARPGSMRDHLPRTSIAIRSNSCCNSPSLAWTMNRSSSSVGCGAGSSGSSQARKRCSSFSNFATDGSSTHRSLHSANNSTDGPMPASKQVLEV